MSKRENKPMLKGLNKKDRPDPTLSSAKIYNPPIIKDNRGEGDIIIKLLESINSKLDKIIDSMPYKNNGMFGPG
jgi:hypothetical protein